MRYDDLIGVPYKPHGRSKEEGFDCYGVALEMCRRAGTPLRDLYEVAELSSELVGRYIDGGVNVRRVAAPKVGGLVEFSCRGKLHVGYIVERGKMIHATTDKGVRVTPTQAMHPTAYYEVTDERTDIQDIKEQG